MCTRVACVDGAQGMVESGMAVFVELGWCDMHDGRDGMEAGCVLVWSVTLSAEQAAA